jgi:hypothetical protein
MNPFAAACQYALLAASIVGGCCCFGGSLLVMTQVQSSDNLGWFVSQLPEREDEDDGLMVDGLIDDSSGPPVAI